MASSGGGEHRLADAEKLNPGDEAQPGAPGTGENTCPACGGSGTLNDAPCEECGGSGIVIEGIGGG
jgi:hypothetical protein